MTNTITPTPNRVEADLIIRNDVANYVEEHGADCSEPFTILRADLSAKVGRVLHEEFLGDVVEYMDHAARAADGSHYDLKVNRARTVTNEDALEEHYLGELTVSMNHLLDLSGFPFGWVNGSGFDLIALQKKAA